MPYPLVFQRRSAGEKIRASHVNELQAALEDLGSVTVNVLDYGATMTGADDTAAFTSAIAAAATNGATVTIPPGTLGFTGDVVVPEKVQLWGAGDGHTAASTTLKCLDAAATLSFGAVGSGTNAGTGGYGGLSGNFMIDANSLATDPLVVGRTLGRTFLNITIKNSAAGGDQCYVAETQNSLFLNLKFIDGHGDHLVLDRGAAGNRFIGLESSGAGTTAGVHLRFQAGGPPASLVAYPVNNHFYGCIFEREGGTPDGGLASVIHYGAGSRNSFTACQFIPGSAASTAILMERTDLALTPFVDLALHECELIDNSTLSTAIDLDDGAQLTVSGRLRINGFLNAYRLRDTVSDVRVLGEIAETSNTNQTHASSVGTYGNIVRRRSAHSEEHVAATSSTIILLGTVSGESGERVRLTPFSLAFNDGSDFTPDTTLQRFASSGVGGLTLDTPFRGTSIWGTAIATKNTTYTTTISDQVILADASGGAFTITLITAVGWPGKRYVIKRTSASNNVTIDANGTQTIDGVLTKTLGSQYAWIELVSDGANWVITSQGGTVT